MVINRILLYVLGILLLASIVYGTYEHFKIDSLSQKVTTLSQDKLNLEQELSNCKANVVDLNTKVAAAKDKSKDFQDKMDDLKDQLVKKDQENKKLVETLKNQPAPKTCDEAKEYLKKNLEIFQ